MKKSFKFNSSIISKLEAVFEKRHLDKNKLLKIKLNSIDKNSNYKTLPNLKKNSKIYKIKYEESKINNYNLTTQYTERINPELIKSNNSHKTCKRILSYREKISNKNHYDNNILKKDLQKFTNNSLTFRTFRKSNKDYQTYTVNAAIKSVLLHINQERENENNKKINELKSIRSMLFKNNDLSNINVNNFVKKNNINSFYLNNINKIKITSKKPFSRNIFRNRTFRKKISKLFIQSTSPTSHRIHVQNYINKNKKDFELRDEVDINRFEDDKLKKKIRNALLNDINPDDINYQLYFDYLKPITNRINFHEDIYLVPHIENNLVLVKPHDNFEILDDIFQNRNLLHKQVSFSLNKMFIMKELLKKSREIEMKKLLEINEYKSKNKRYNDDNIFDKKISPFEKNFEHFELTDYFWKINNYGVIGFANKKLKDTIFKKKFIKD